MHNSQGSDEPRPVEPDGKILDIDEALGLVSFGLLADHVHAIRLGRGNTADLRATLRRYDRISVAISAYFAVLDGHTGAEALDELRACREEIRSATQSSQILVADTEGEEDE